MFNKKILSLVVGYVLGGLVSSVYSKKKPGELEKEIKESKKTGESEISILLDNFIETHKNLLESIKKEPIYQEKKKELLDILDSYKKQGKELLKELKENGKDYVVEASKKLEELYNEKKEEIESLKDVAPEKTKELKDKLLASYEEIKEKIKKTKK